MTTDLIGIHAIFGAFALGANRSARQQSGAGTYRSPGRSGDRSAAAGIWSAGSING